MRYLPILLLIGCASQPAPLVSPLIPPDEWAERVSEPPGDPATKELPDKLPKGEHVEAVAIGEPAPFTGILVSPERAWRDIQYKIAYKGLRDIDQADRTVWFMHRAIYEERNLTAQKEIQRLQPSFWDEYGTILSYVIGFTVGSAITGSVAAVLFSVK